ncbi:3-deoxy-D-manno-octulosonate 8-phosphate phosphatase KdsC [invertebrate metagenome]|uniref:3-deoxy-D-manno-octulosonate 8-phosphate phosphatase KdsC n=1 Tax=invertebrate metagenome TaxID=1711999 RepID=A0A2H9T9X8_9ZZZZ
MNTQSSSLTDIQLVIFDVDGVLTDGTLYYGESGEHLKTFNVKDGVGFNLLKDNHVHMAIITAKQSQSLKKRMDDLGIDHFYPGCHDKLAAFSELKQILSLTNDQIAYVGDDVIDLPVMNKVGIAIAPDDAYPLVKQQADIVTHSRGGQGVVREVADLLVGARTDLSSAYSRLTGIRIVQ